MSKIGKFDVARNFRIIFFITSDQREAMKDLIFLSNKIYMHNPGSIKYMFIEYFSIFERISNEKKLIGNHIYRRDSMALILLFALLSSRSNHNDIISPKFNRTLGEVFIF